MEMDKNIEQLLALEAQAAEATRQIEDELAQLAAKAKDGLVARLGELKKRGDERVKEVERAGRAEQKRQIAHVQAEYTRRREDFEKEFAAGRKKQRAALVHGVLYGGAAP